MTLEDIQREIAALPETLPPLDGEGEVEGGAAPPGGSIGPLQIVSKQGRLILRLSAALEALEARVRGLSDESRSHRAVAETASDDLRKSERWARQLALECIHLMDALDWVQEATRARGDDRLAAQILSAQRDCLRRLAAAGITEIPAPRGTAMDGRLHSGLEAVAADGDGGDGADGAVEKYQIVELVRRGYQCGTDVLRRAEVKTAA